MGWERGDGGQTDRQAGGRARAARSERTSSERRSELRVSYNYE